MDIIGNTNKITQFPGSIHNHTQYSNLRLRDCIIKEEDLIKYAVELGHEVVGITDHEAVCNAVKVEKIYKKIKKDHPNFKLIRGNEIYLCRNGLNASNFNKDTDKYYHFCLYAKNATGHKQIREISTRAWMRSYMARGMRRVPTYYQDLFDIIGENPGHVIGSTACFVAGTQIPTKQGFKNIEDIQTNDMVKNRYGEWEKVNFPTSRFYDDIGYKIFVTSGEREITCTKNHKFLATTLNWQRTKTPLRWVEAENLITIRGSDKHILLEPLEENNFSLNDKILKKEFKGSFFNKESIPTQYSLPEEIKITPELMRLFGLFLGDGCLSLKKNPRLQFTLNIKEYESYWNSFIKKVAEQLGIKWSVSFREQYNRVDIASSSIELVDLFHWLFGPVQAKTKKIPNRLINISPQLNYELIFGYMLADGHFRQRTIKGYETNEFVSASISHELSKQIHKMLNSLGITCSISKSVGRVDKEGVNHQDAWYVHGSNKFLGNFKKEKEYTHEDVVDCFEKSIAYKKKEYQELEGVLYKKVRIKKKEKILLNEQVYCLNVNSHSFVCENVVVHNCLGGALPTQILKWIETRDNTLYEKIGIWIEQMSGLFGEGNFFFELQPSASKEQTIANKELLKLSKEKNIPYIFTTDSHYLEKKDAKIHSAFLKSQNGDREVESFYATTYMMDTEELESYLLKDLAIEDIKKGYQNIQVIADMCEDYSLQKDLKIPDLKWKTFNPKSSPKELAFLHNQIPHLKNFVESDYVGDRVLADAIIEGIEKDPHLQNGEAYKAIDECLEMTWTSSLVNNTHWSAYYLNLQNIIDVCWEAGSLVGAGRGSGVGFILLYILGITQINPLRETTPTFAWRFINPSRVSILDVDFDIESSRRGMVLEKFREIYGRDRVSNVATFGTEKSKSAIQTAARGLGIDIDIAAYISSLVPSDRGTPRTLTQCFYGDKEAGFEPVKQFVVEMTNNYPEIWEVAQKIEGLINRLGQHAGGVIFVDEPFTNSTSLMRAPDGTIITAFDLHDCEDVS